MVEAKLLRKKLKNGLIVDKWDLVTIIEKQQAEIDRLNYDLDGFKQNFFVSGFHLQIKMANEQLVKQQEQIDALKSELDRAVELYTDKAIENEALKMGFAGNGTSDSELAEVRAQANRWFLKIKEQQAEIEALKKHNEELQKACVDSLVWVMGNGVYCSLDIEVILKNVLGSEWEDYK